MTTLHGSTDRSTSPQPPRLAAFNFLKKVGVKTAVARPLIEEARTFAEKNYHKSQDGAKFPEGRAHTFDEYHSWVEKLHPLCRILPATFEVITPGHLALIQATTGLTRDLVARDTPPIPLAQAELYGLMPGHYNSIVQMCQLASTLGRKDKLPFTKNEAAIFMGTFYKHFTYTEIARDVLFNSSKHAEVRSVLTSIIPRALTIQVQA